MKTSLAILAILALGSVQADKLFHEHFLDFEMLIIEESAQELEKIAEQYLQFDEFLKTVDFLLTTDFRDLMFEMEALPEFIEVVNFLEKNNIDILFFIDLLNEGFENLDRLKKSANRQQVTGTDFTSYTNDVIATFPKNKLAALYDEKIAEDSTFKAAMEALNSDEWNEIFGALWDSPVFQEEVKSLAEYGIDVNQVINQLIAVLGQL